MPPRLDSDPQKHCISLGLCRVFGVRHKQCTRKWEIQKTMFLGFYIISHKITKNHGNSCNSKKCMVCRRRRRNTNEFTVLGMVFGSPRTLNSMNFIKMEDYGVFSWDSSIFMIFHGNPLFPLKSQECGEMGVFVPPCVDLLCFIALFEMFLGPLEPPEPENSKKHILWEIT